MSARFNKAGPFVFVIVAGLSLAVRVYPLSRPGATWAMTPDSIGYIELAEGIKAGCGFAALMQGKKCGPAELERTPGYPLFLAASSGPRTVVAIQAVLGAGTAVLVGLFAWWQWGFVAGLIAEFIAGFDLSSFIVGSQIMSEILFTSIVTLACLLEMVMVCRKSVDRRTVVGLTGAGLLFAIAALVRPIGQVLLLVPTLGAMGLSKVSLSKRIILCLLTVSIPLATILGWSYRNYRQRGAWTFSSISAIDLYYYRAAAVLAHESGRNFDEVLMALLRSTGHDPAVDLWSQTFDENPGELTARATKVIRAYPWTFAYITFSSFPRICIMPANRLELSRFLGHRPDRAEIGALLTRDILSSLYATLSSGWLIGIRALLSFQLLVMIFTWIGVALALWRIRFAPTPAGWLILIPLSTGLLLLGAAAGPEAVGRYRVASMPMLALLAALGWTSSNARQIRDRSKASVTNRVAQR